MKKFVLIHSYSDLNKGDAAILISTVQNLRALYPGCRVDLISTFSSKDNLFHTDHNEIRKYADNLYTSLMPQMFLNYKGKSRYSTFSKIISMLYMLPKYTLSAFGIRYFGRAVCLTQDELKSIKSIKEADVVISKGGSFLSSRGGFRDGISLARMLYPFYIAKIFDKKTIILSQSVGPFKDSFSRGIFNSSLKYIDEIYFREFESVSLIKENGILIDDVKVKYCPDVAFSLVINESENIDSIVNLSSKKLCAGMTIVNFPFNSECEREKYINSMVTACDKLSETHDVYIFPQVVTHNFDVDYKPDIELSYEISRRSSNKVNVINGNFTSSQLCKLYRKCDLFIASRLHSSIFALSQGVPCINISYHGTKAEGTFGLLGLERFVISNVDISPIKMNMVLDNLLANRTDLRVEIVKEHRKIVSLIENAFIDLTK